MDPQSPPAIYTFRVTLCCQCIGVVTFGKESWSDLSERCKRMSTSAVCKERVIGRAREQLLVGGGLPQKGGES